MQRIELQRLIKTTCLLFTTALIACLVLLLLPSVVVAQTNTFPTTVNVGIGTTSPAAPLQVVYPYGKTDATTRSIVEFSSNDSSGRFKLYFKAKGDASLANRFVWLQTGDDNIADGGNLLLQPNGGNVGVGTTSPNAKFEVDGTNKIAIDAANSAVFLSNPNGPNSFSGANYDRLAIAF